MEKTLFALSLGFLGLILATQAAIAAQCAPRDQVAAGLATGFDETRRAIGLSSPSQVLEIFASEVGSWTIIVTGPDGMTCLVASGQGFEAMPKTCPPRAIRHRSHPPRRVRIDCAPPPSYPANPSQISFNDTPRSAQVITRKNSFSGTILTSFTPAKTAKAAAGINITATFRLPGENWPSAQ